MDKINTKNSKKKSRRLVRFVCVLFARRNRYRGIYDNADGIFVGV